MKRFPFIFCPAFLLLLVLTGIVSAASINSTNLTDTTMAAATTETVITVGATTSPGRIGGSIYFETYPPGATVSVENVTLGTSAFTYYSEKTGPLDVRIRKKGYEDFTGTVIVEEGKRVVFTVDLKPVSRSITDENTPAEPVTTVTTFRKSTMVMPTPWPSTTESPVDPALVIGAVMAGVGFVVIRRR